jgi:hypothetical protein
MEPITEQMMEHLLDKIAAVYGNVASHHEKMMADIRTWRKEMKADGEAMEARLGKIEANPEETQSESEHPDVPKEEAVV